MEENNVDSLKSDEEDSLNQSLNYVDQEECAGDTVDTNVDFVIDHNSSNVVHPEKAIENKENETFVVSDYDITNEARKILEEMTIKIINRDEEESKSEDNHPLLPGCNCKAKKCDVNLDEASRKRIHRQFWEMESHARKLWIYSHVKLISPKRRYVVHDKDEERRRKYTREFCLPTASEKVGDQVSVCQKMFLSTLGYRTDNILRNLQKSTDDCDVVQEDKKGRHAPAHKISTEDETFLMNHIHKYKPGISHYRREHAPKRLYLPPELDITEMYNDYKLCVEEAGRKMLSYVTYWRHVKAMNISFAKLGVEECETCDGYKIHIEEMNKPTGDSTKVVRKKSRKSKEKEAAATSSAKKQDSEQGSSKESTRKVTKQGKTDRCSGKCETCDKYAVHAEEKRLSLKEYSADKVKAETDTNTLFLSTDLQKIILLPRLPGYKKCLFTSRLIAFNQTFAPIGKRGKAHNFKPVGVLWHEAIAGRKDENITSAFKKIFSYPKFRDYERWVLWADNCGGQNKCWTLFTMLVGTVNSDDTCIERLTIKYLTTRHTFMSADNFHRSVEREMKKMDKVYDFDDFKECVNNAGDIMTMECDNFFAFKSGLSEGQVSKKSRPKLKDVSVLEFRRGSLNLFFKLRHDDDHFEEADFLQHKVKKVITALPAQQQNSNSQIIIILKAFWFPFEVAF